MLKIFFSLFKSDTIVLVNEGVLYMESLKSIYHNMSDMSKMLIKILLGIIIGLVAVCLLALLLRLIVGVKKDY